MQNGTFQPIVVIDDGGQGGAIFGDPRSTARKALNVARRACDVASESALPAHASAMALMGSAPPQWLRVSERTFAKHEKPGRPPSVLTKYRCGLVTHKGWLFPEHGGLEAGEARRFWSLHGGSVPFPTTVDEWLRRAGELRGAAVICVRPDDGKFIAVIDTSPVRARA
jgi:DNA repair protein RadD